MDQRAWDKRLKRAEKELGFTDGYKFVYGPWETLENAEVAFISLNPGRAPDDADMRTLSDERGNSYEVERLATKSPITDQFLRLADLLGRRPTDVLAGVAAPFRSGNWMELSRSQRSGSLELGQEFWRAPFNRRNLRLILACSNEAARLAVEVTGASLEEEALAGWGSIKLRRYRCRDGKVILHLPHLSRFKLLGREPSESVLRKALRGAM